MDNNETPATPPPIADFICAALSPDKRFACTAEFGHDGDHYAQDPTLAIVARWERRATD